MFNYNKNQEENFMYNVSIPEISREELLARYEHIKPIVDIGGTK